MLTQNKKEALQEILDLMKTKLGISEALIKTISGLLVDWIQIH